MYILLFFLVFSITQWVTNKMLNISDDNINSYTYSKRDGFVILGFLLVAIGLCFTKFTGKMFWTICGGYAAMLFFTMLVLAAIKRQEIEKQRAELQQIFEVLTPVLPKNLELDMNNPPFKLEYEKNKVNKITIEINPNTFKESVASNLCLSLNKFLPTYEWLSDFDYAARECSFKGTPLPPEKAKYPGGWLRPPEWFTLGLNGKGEVPWIINTPKNQGRSLYVYDDGKRANTIQSPSAPQALVVGSPLGLKTVIPTTKGYKTMETIKQGDKVFGYKNKPVEVVEVLDIHMPNTTYTLSFTDAHNNSIDVISDEVHRFPVLHDGKTMATHCKDLKEGDIILGNKSNYMLVGKSQVENELVRCIKVASEEHIFLISEQEEKWKGGSKYPYPAMYTYNTGGGKAIYVEQEVDIIKEEE